MVHVPGPAPWITELSVVDLGEVRAQAVAERVVRPQQIELRSAQGLGGVAAVPEVAVQPNR